MSTALEDLIRLGFSQYEAEAYLALLQHGPQNGYELAKTSGIPRANIYAVLKKLEERSAVLHAESAEGKRYTAVPSNELLQRLQRQFEASFESARQAMAQITPPAEAPAIWSALGYSALLEHAEALVAQAKEKLLLAVFPAEAQALETATQQSRRRGVDVTTLCLAGCPSPCPHCQGQVHRLAAETPAGARWLLLVPDDEQMLAGEVSPGVAQAVRTRQALLVNLASEYIRQTIALATILQALGVKSLSQLDPDTQQSLRSLSKDDGWLNHMDLLMKS